MSAEDQNSDNSIEKTALRLFNKYKVEISQAIVESYPFLEHLRDHGFITDEIYAVSKESFKKGHNVEEAAYTALAEAQKKFEPSLLKILFNEFTLKKYPGLNHTYEIFKNAIPDKNFFLRSDTEENEEMHDIQSRLEQDLLANPLATASCWAPNLEHTSRRLESVNKEEARYYPVTVLGGNSGNSCISHYSASHKVGFYPHGVVEIHTAPHHQKSWSLPFPLRCCISTSPEVTGGVLCDCNCNPVSMLAEQLCAGSLPSHIAVPFKKPLCATLRNASAERRNREEPHEAPSSALTREPGAGQHPSEPVDFAAEILPVACKTEKGLLIKRKLERGTTRKCIRSEDGNWYNPREFEVRGGYGKSSNWKTSLTCRGKTLKELMELGKLHTPPKTIDRKKKVGNSDKCEICQDGGKLFGCATCYRFFHGDCHLPPVDTRRSSWICTFCTIQNSSRSQQRYRESEILVKQMGPEEKLKCEFLLLKVYYHLESNIFLNIPHEIYVRNASEYLRKLRMLDRIKRKLIKGNYPQVEDLVRAMDNFFWDPRCKYLHSIKEEFKNNFKEVFAIQETN
ncbi:nuclear body protein SP140-like protein [Pteronotus mesoamericanus]|uniref:nuclear body protein SP140-like protein n=1 Tax=Pteronotus mesoamericanus TaxID=1884717 RepID=UPI0023ECC19A|nr:nuclear body protein SP140-like protein [Pteronotus parnellii mesoamericanus]